MPMERSAAVSLAASCAVTADGGGDPNPDRDILEERLDQALGHARKLFEGGCVSENLGSSFGGWGTFLPVEMRQPSQLAAASAGPPRTARPPPALHQSGTALRRPKPPAPAPGILELVAVPKGLALAPDPPSACDDQEGRNSVDELMCSAKTGSGTSAVRSKKGIMGTNDVGKGPAGQMNGNGGVVAKRPPLSGAKAGRSLPTTTGGKLSIKLKLPPGSTTTITAAAAAATRCPSHHAENQQQQLSEESEEDLESPAGSPPPMSALDICKLFTKDVIPPEEVLSPLVMKGRIKRSNAEENGGRVTEEGTLASLRVACHQQQQHNGGGGAAAASVVSQQGKSARDGNKAGGGLRDASSGKKNHLLHLMGDGEHKRPAAGLRREVISRAQNVAGQQLGLSSGMEGSGRGDDPGSSSPLLHHHNREGLVGGGGGGGGGGAAGKAWSDVAAGERAAAGAKASSVMVASNAHDGQKSSHMEVKVRKSVTAAVEGGTPSGSGILPPPVPGGKAQKKMEGRQWSNNHNKDAHGDEMMVDVTRGVAHAELGHESDQVPQQHKGLSSSLSGKRKKPSGLSSAVINHQGGDGGSAMAAEGVAHKRMEQKRRRHEEVVVSNKNSISTNNMSSNKGGGTAGAPPQGSGRGGMMSGESRDGLPPGAVKLETAAAAAPPPVSSAKRGVAPRSPAPAMSASVGATLKAKGKVAPPPQGITAEGGGASKALGKPRNNNKSSFLPGKAVEAPPRPPPPPSPPPPPPASVAEEMGVLPQAVAAGLAPIQEWGWVQCDKCSKWRLLPLSVSVDNNRRWFCKMNTWSPLLASCKRSEVETSNAVFDMENTLPEERLRVLATLDGYVAPPVPAADAGAGAAVELTTTAPASAAVAVAAQLAPGGSAAPPPPPPSLAFAADVDTGGRQGLAKTAGGGGGGLAAAMTTGKKGVAKRVLPVDESGMEGSAGVQRVKSLNQVSSASKKWLASGPAQQKYHHRSNGNKSGNYHNKGENKAGDAPRLEKKRDGIKSSMAGKDCGGVKKRKAANLEEHSRRMSLNVPNPSEQPWDGIKPGTLTGSVEKKKAVEMVQSRSEDDEFVVKVSGSAKRARLPEAANLSEEEREDDDDGPPPPKKKKVLKAVGMERDGGCGGGGGGGAALHGGGDRSRMEAARRREPSAAVGDGYHKSKTAVVSCREEVKGEELAIVGKQKGPSGGAGGRLEEERKQGRQHHHQLQHHQIDGQGPSVGKALGLNNKGSKHKEEKSPPVLPRDAPVFKSGKTRGGRNDVLDKEVDYKERGEEAERDVHRGTTTEVTDGLTDAVVGVGVGSGMNGNGSGAARAPVVDVGRVKSGQKPREYHHHRPSSQSKTTMIAKDKPTAAAAVARSDKGAPPPQATKPSSKHKALSPSASSGGYTPPPRPPLGLESNLENGISYDSTEEEEEGGKMKESASPMESTLASPAHSQQDDEDKEEERADGTADVGAVFPAHPGGGGSKTSVMAQQHQDVAVQGSSAMMMMEGGMRMMSSNINNTTTNNNADNNSPAELRAAVAGRMSSVSPGRHHHHHHHTLAGGGGTGGGGVSGSRRSRSRSEERSMDVARPDSLRGADDRSYSPEASRERERGDREREHFGRSSSYRSYDGWYDEPLARDDVDHYSSRPSRFFGTCRYDERSRSHERYREHTERDRGGYRSSTRDRDRDGYPTASRERDRERERDWDRDRVREESGSSRPTWERERGRERERPRERARAEPEWGGRSSSHEPRRERGVAVGFVPPPTKKGLDSDSAAPVTTVTAAVAVAAAGGSIGGDAQLLKAKKSLPAGPMSLLGPSELLVDTGEGGRSWTGRGAEMVPLERHLHRLTPPAGGGDDNHDDDDDGPPGHIGGHTEDDSREMHEWGGGQNVAYLDTVGDEDGGRGCGGGAEKGGGEEEKRAVVGRSVLKEPLRLGTVGGVAGVGLTGRARAGPAIGSGGVKEKRDDNAEAWASSAAAAAVCGGGGVGSSSLAEAVAGPSLVVAAAAAAPSSSERDEEGAADVLPPLPSGTTGPSPSCAVAAASTDFAKWLKEAKELKRRADKLKPSNKLRRDLYMESGFKFLRCAGICPMEPEFLDKTASMFEFCAQHDHNRDPLAIALALRCAAVARTQALVARQKRMADACDALLAAVPITAAAASALPAAPTSVNKAGPSAAPAVKAGSSPSSSSASDVDNLNITTQTAGILGHHDRATLTPSTDRHHHINSKSASATELHRSSSASAPPLPDAAAAITAATSSSITVPARLTSNYVHLLHDMKSTCAMLESWKKASAATVLASESVAKKKADAACGECSAEDAASMAKSLEALCRVGEDMGLRSIEANVAFAREAMDCMDY